MVLVESIVVVYFNHQDHVIPLNEFTREEIRCEINKSFKSDINLIRKATLTFFRGGEHFCYDDNTVKHSSVTDFKTYLERM